MLDLNGLVVFAKVAEAGSFSKAALRLGMPLSTVSRRVMDLENALGVRLLERSTRRLRLTDIGIEILAQAQRGAEVGDTVASIVSDRRADVAGTLRLSAPPSIAESLLAPLIGAFQADYPDVRVQVLVTDRLVDHIQEGIDLVLRVGPLPDSGLVARRLLRYRHRLLASPDYLADHGQPASPTDLLRHRLLAFSSWTAETRWRFVGGDVDQAIRFQPYLAMNDYAGLATALLAAGGIGELPPIVSPLLVANGRLVEVMPDWRFQAVDLSMVQVANRHQPRAVRVFKAFADRIAPTLFAALPT